MNDEILLEELFGSTKTSIDIALSYSRVSDFDRNTTANLIDVITNNYNEVPDNDTILDIIKANDYWKGTSDEIRLSKFVNNKEFFGYLNAFYESKNKIVITTNDLLLGKELAETIKIHDFSSYLFTDFYKRYTQYKFNIEYRGVKFRGIIDFILIDTKNKIVQFIDLKTGQEDSLNFMKSFIKYRYYFQEAVYVKAFDQICEELGLKGYALAPFKFLYISRYEKIPLEWTVTEKWHNAAINGFTTNSGYKYKGLNEIIDEIKWHWQNNIFDLPKAIYESNGILSLEDNFIEIN